MQRMLIKFLQENNIKFYDFPMSMRNDTIFFYGKDGVRIYVSRFLDRYWQVRINDAKMRMSPTLAMETVRHYV